jgi:hypothetical protein
MLWPMWTSLWNIFWWRNVVNNASIYGTNLRKALHIAACLGICKRMRCLQNSIMGKVSTIEKQKTDITARNLRLWPMICVILVNQAYSMCNQVKPTLSFWGAPCHGGDNLNSGLLTASSIHASRHIVWEPLQKAADFNCCSHDWQALFQTVCRWSWMCCALHIGSLPVGNTCFVTAVFDVCEVQTVDQIFANRQETKIKHSWMHSENGKQHGSTFACLMLRAVLQ